MPFRFHARSTRSPVPRRARGRRVGSRPLALATAALSVAALAAVVPRTARAQAYLLSRGVSLNAGAARWDLDERGTTGVVALRGDAELTPWLAGELGLSALRPNERIGRLTYVVPEAQLQLQARAGALVPYVGAGAAWWLGVGPTRKGRSHAAGSLSAGVRVLLGDPRFGLRADVRALGLGRDLDQTVVAYTAGAALRF